MSKTDTFVETLNSIIEIPPDQTDKILSIRHIQQISKGEHFVREGDIPKNFAFVSKGLFRYYYLDNKGNDFTKGFFLENSFISSYSALIQNRGSYFNIEALEDSIIFVFNFDKWKILFDNESFWHKLLIFLLEKGYCNKETREREFLLFSAEERYKSFLQTFPGLEERIKQHLIASYLGITPVALSRIRSKMKER